jgi:transcriptional regulator with GAF, ATPase, and Fis domain
MPRRGCWSVWITTGHWFLSRLAHEIGTPLNVIQGRAEQLLLRDSLSEKDRAVIHVIVAQIERISNFIRQLLTLARRPEPQLRLINVNDSVRRVWEIIGEQEHAEGVTITLDLAEGEIRRLQQAVETHYHFDRIIGKSPAMQHVFALVDRLKDSNVNVLLTGESGTGIRQSRGRGELTLSPQPANFSAVNAQTST